MYVYSYVCLLSFDRNYTYACSKLIHSYIKDSIQIYGPKMAQHKSLELFPIPISFWLSQL